jgi:hypothetical protein
MWDTGEEGPKMHPLYTKAMNVVEELKEARLKVVHTASELTQAEYALCLTQAKVERDLIKKVGSERALAPTVDDRTRIFVRALDADQDYKAQLQRRDALETELGEAKAEVASLHDKLNVMLAAMRTAADEI